MDRPAQVPVTERVLFNGLLAAEHFLGARRVDRLTRGAPERLQQRLAARLARRGPAAFHDPDRHRNLDPQEFRERYLEPGVPVILEGAARDWEATRTWSLDFFRERYGDARILRQDLQGFNPAGQRWDGGPADQTLGEAIAEMQAGKSTYVRFGTVVDEHPELQRMLDLAWLERYRNPRARGTAYNFFVGRAGTITQLHAAVPCNLFVMVRGRKRWTLYPAASTAALRPGATGGQYFYSDADPFAPDASRWPAMPYLDGYRFDLEEGDVLYNPPYMWHHVENLTDSVGIGYRFVHARSTLRASWTLPLLRLFAWNPPPWVTLRSAFGGQTIRALTEWKTAPEAGRPRRD